MSTPPAPAVCAVATALPPHYASQSELAAALKRLWSTQHYNVERFEQLLQAVQVDGRYLALPTDAYFELDTFARCNDRWIECAQALGERVCRDVLAQAQLMPDQIDHIFFTTVTGIATPSIDARLVNRIGLRSDIKRTPLFGLGCVAGAAGLARVGDYLRAFPRQRSLLVSVELCSLTLQRQDLSVANVIASGLFGDGAAAVLVCGAEHATAGAPRIVDSHAVLYPDTERVMGWDLVDTGFKIVLSAQVPELVRMHVRKDVDAFLQRHGLRRGDITHWIVHSGGPKVLEALSDALELDAGALDRSWCSLRQVGNLSSASVLFVLRSFLQEAQAQPGDLGVVMAMGPAFCSEMVLLRW